MNNNINFSLFHKTFIINQLIEQTKLNIARLNNLEIVVRNLKNNIADVTLENCLNNVVNGYKLFGSTSITNVESDALFNNLINVNNMYSNKIDSIILPKAEFINMVETDLGRTDMEIAGINIKQMILPSAKFTNIKSLRNRFYNYSFVTIMNLSSATFENVTTLYQMFCNCSNLIECYLNNATFDNVTNTKGMFNNCNKLTTLNIESAIFDNLVEVENMFSNTKITNLKLPNTTFNKVNDGFMFNNMSELITLYIPNATFASLSRKSNMFNNCNKLKYVYITTEGFNKINTVLPDRLKWSYDDNLKCYVRSE